MKREGGYTVVETGLAVAVSAALVLLTIGLASMVGRRRFQDSLTTTQSFIQMQYNEVRAGINARFGGDGSDVLGCGSTSAGNSTNCYTIGRLLTFANDSGNGVVKSSYIIAKAPNSAWPDTQKSGIDNLNEATLYAVTGDNSADAGLNPTTKVIGGNTIDYAWSIMNNGNDVTPTNNANARLPKTNIALMRSPLDGSMIVASNVNLGNTSNGVQQLTLVDNAGEGSSINISSQDKIVLGIANGGLGQQGGLICIAGGDNSAGVSNNNNVNLNDYVNNVAGWQNRLKEACKNWE